MNPFLQVAIGGALGATCRYAIYRVMPLAWSATLLVNVAGSFAMGLLAALLAHRLGNAWAPFLLTGVLDVLTLWERGQGVMALAYVGLSVLLSLAAVMAGLALGRGIWA